MRILIDTRTVGLERSGSGSFRHESGTGNYVFELVRALAQLRTEHEFLLLHHGPSRLRELELPENFSSVEAPFGHENHPMGDLWEDWVLPNRLAKLGIDVMHGPAYLIPTLTSRAARVVTILDLVPFSHASTVPLKYAWYMRRLVRRAAKVADRIVAISQAAREEILDRLSPKAPVRCVHLGVSSRFSPQSPERVAEVRERYGLRPNTILFVGNLEPRKNLPGLLKGFASAVREGLDIELAIAGRAAWKSSGLLDTIERDGMGERVKTLGYVPSEDLPVLYASASAFAFPTLHEGFGLPILEAMASGTPVVTSELPVTREVAGESAVFVRPDSPESIAQGLREACDPTRRDELIEAGFRQARKFRWTETARQTLEVYESAVR